MQSVTRTPRQEEPPAASGTAPVTRDGAGPVAVERRNDPDAAEEDGKRDRVAWYEALTEDERRAFRDRVLTASSEDVKADDDLRYFFIFHVDDLAHDQPPGTRRLIEAYRIVMLLRGQEDAEDDRRKAVRILLGAYQAFLRDNPFIH